jgi:Flp pilus assembly protein TadD
VRFIVRAFIALVLTAVFAYADSVDKGIAAFENGNLQEAVKQFSIAIKENPKRDAAYVLRGLAYGSLGDYSKAIADFTQAIKLDPNDAGAYRMRGFIYLKFEDNAKALSDFSRAIRINPNDAVSYSMRAVIFNLSGDFQSAMQDARKACDLGDCEGLLLIQKNQPKSQQAKREEFCWNMLTHGQNLSGGAYEEYMKTVEKMGCLNPYR